jgi:FlaA1/EpsC-like NDP-sugar epimerase
MKDDPGRYSSLHASEHAVRNRLIGLPRRTKQLMMLLADAVGFFGCVALSTWVHVSDTKDVSDLSLAALGTMLVAHLLARHLGFYSSIIRYLGMGLLVAAAYVAIGSALALGVAGWWFGLTAQPLKLVIAYAAFCGLYLVGSRYIAQYFLMRRSPTKKNVLVYGAGEAGARVVHAMHGNQSYRPVAFIDDDDTMDGKRINGIRVYPSRALRRLIDEHQVADVLLAFPSASRRRRQEIISSLEELAVHVKTVPNFDDLISGKARVDEIREVDVEDLLSRPPVAPDASLMQATLLGKSVMVTGAGGSIGSELCRQILRVRPKILVLFELSEVALYTIDQEMRALSEKLDIDTEIVPLLGSVQDADRVYEVMRHFGTHTVYHAAAYKHVPMVEQNVIEGVANNVLGTYRTAKSAIRAKVETFVLVSTDKAVSPTSIMGASKRFAELVLQALQGGNKGTRFAMVRFGNVLESSGSVVPLFRKQIRDGGPVTVTHPEIIRYFMTIPEAAQLVIHAGGLAHGGEVFVLDMGQPVKIRDLAMRMIRLMGLTVRDDKNPHGDIEISFTGLRPAEKLYEELLIGENVSGTEHPRIMQAREDYVEGDVLRPLLDELEQSVRDRDVGRARDILMRTVQEYCPTNGIDDIVWVETQSVEAGPSKIVNLNPGASRSS